MKKINLRDYYPYYTQDMIVEVPDEVALLLREYMLLEEAYRIRTYRYKAFYSLDRDEGIEREILQKPLNPAEIWEQRQMTELIYKGLSKLVVECIITFVLVRVSKIRNNLCKTFADKRMCHSEWSENTFFYKLWEGCYLKNDEYSLFFEGTGFEAVDTTGGADSFISALAVYLSEGHKLIESIDFAIYASGISVTRYGVQPALPDRKSVDIYEGEIHKKYNDRRRMKKE